MLSFDGYIFYKENDSKGHDVYYQPEKSIQELKGICDWDENCVGFNTYGCVKNRIASTLDFVHLPNINKHLIDGIYVNEKRYREQFSHIEFTDYDFISGHDFNNYDVTHEPHKNIYDLKLICDTDDNYVAFNTHGYVKYHINRNQLIPFYNNFRHGHGLYIKKDVKYNLIISNPIPDNTLYKNIKGFCINLARRPDRKEKMVNVFKAIDLPIEFYEAIDGKTLELTDEIKHLLRNNNYNWQKSVVGCTLSHYNLLVKLFHDDVHDKYLIFEDDLELSPLFNQRINCVINDINNHPEYDIIFLAHSIPRGNRGDISIARSNDITLPLRVRQFNNKKSLGGTFAYIITKQLAIKVMNFIKTNSISKAIDSFYIDSDFDTNKVEIIPHLAYTEYVDIDVNVDSDIHNSLERFNE